MPSKEDYERAGRMVRRRRKEWGFTQGQAAELAHLSDRTVRSIERGVESNFHDVGALMAVLGWEPRSWTDMLAGGEPTLITEPDAIGKGSARASGEVSSAPEEIGSSLRDIRNALAHNRTVDEASVEKALAFLISQLSSEQTRALLVIVQGMIEAQATEAVIAERRLARAADSQVTPSVGSQLRAAQDVAGEEAQVEP